MSTLLEVKNLKKYFKTPGGMLHAVDDVSFSINRGETLGVVGESGCGKSTLGRTVIHLLPKTSGQIIFDGEDISDVDDHKLKELRRDMQMIFQDPFSSLNPRMSISQIISEPLKIYHVCKNSKELDSRVTALMETVGLALRFRDAYPHELDGGRRQRVGIARALALDPRFIVCDEPVSALDVSIQAQILNLMQDLQKERGLTFIFITHDLSVVKHISDNISVMYLGNMVELANTQELFDHPLHPYTEALMAAIPTTDVEENRELRILEGDIPSPVNPPQGCKFHTRCAHCTEICKHAVPEWKEMAPGHFVACHHPLSEKE